MEGRTSLVIAHRIQSVMTADLILVLDHGRIVQRGTHEELLAQEGIYRRVFDIQTRIEADLEQEIAHADSQAHTGLELAPAAEGDHDQ
jgi:ATP-binding cassette subfamily B protein